MTHPAQDASVPRSGLGAEYLKYLACHSAESEALVQYVRADELAAVAYSGRFLPTPVFVSAAERKAIAANLRMIYALVTQLPERIFGGDLAGLARAVGMTQTQVCVVDRGAKAGPPLFPLARSDLYRDAGGFKLLELNITSALGGFENACINRAMLAHPLLSAFVTKHRLGYVDTLRGIVDTLFAECAEQLDTVSRPVVALADWPESFRTYEPRLKVMAALLGELGIDALPCHVGQIQERGGRLEVNGRVIDVVYRFFLVEEIANPDDARLIEPILHAVEEGRVGLFSRLDAELYGNKGALALLSDDRHRAAFSEQERACIDRFLPWTRFVRRTATDPGGREVELVRHALGQQQDLILKPTLLHGGSGVVPGWTVTAEEWKVRLAEAMDGPYVIQQRIRPLPEPFPAFTSDGFEDLFFAWGVFLTDPAVTKGDGYNGCLLRGSTDPHVGVVSMSGGARVACAFHESPGSA